MTLAYMRYRPRRSACRRVMTVHNLAFQGQFGAAIFAELGLPAAAMALDGVEYYGGVGFLKGGLQAAWAITTVSPTYAQEIRTPEFGMGLDGLIGMRAADLLSASSTASTPTSGTRRPTRTDRALLHGTTLKAAPRNRARGRGAFRPRCTTTARSLRGQPPDLAEGHGHPGRRARRARRHGRASSRCSAPATRRSKARCSPAAARHRGRVGVVIGYDEGLSHLMQGGCDAILDSVALRAVRADPALRPALRLRAGRRAHRRACRHGHRRQ